MIAAKRETLSFHEGYRNGRLDKLLNHRSEYVWATRDYEPNYTYSLGYKEGWSSAHDNERFNIT
jgi:hypothetical protein